MKYMNFVPSGDMMLGNWLMYWLEMYIRPIAKASTYESYRGHCEKHIIPALGNTKLKDLTSKQLQQFFNEETKTGNGKTGGALQDDTEYACRSGCGTETGAGRGVASQ